MVKHLHNKIIHNPVNHPIQAKYNSNSKISSLWILAVDIVEVKNRICAIEMCVYKCCKEDKMARVGVRQTSPSLGVAYQLRHAKRHNYTTLSWLQLILTATN